MGSNGSVYVNGTAVTEGNFIAIQFTEDSVIAAISGQLDNSAGLIADAITFNKGDCLYLPFESCLLYTSPSPRDVEESRMPSSA